MSTITPGNRLRGRQPLLNYLEPEVPTRKVPKAKVAKPARLTRRECEPLLALLRRVATGGDTTTAVDAMTLIPLVERGLAAAPVGHRKARAYYDARMPDNVSARVHGVEALAKLTGKAKSTLANALSQGKGTATFDATDEHGNPATITVTRVVP